MTSRKCVLSLSAIVQIQDGGVGEVSQKKTVGVMVVT